MADRCPVYLFVCVLSVIKMGTDDYTLKVIYTHYILYMFSYKSLLGLWLSTQHLYGLV